MTHCQRTWRACRVWVGEGCRQDDGAGLAAAELGAAEADAVHVVGRLCGARMCARLMCNSGCVVVLIKLDEIADQTCG